MKFSLAIALAASLFLSGCSVFRKSPTWDSVVASRSQYSGSTDPKDGYLNHLHQVLRDAGVEHKLVTYQFHFNNPYREDAQVVTAILYRDSSTPDHPWWAMDDFHHVPTWLPNWDVDAQLEFFIQHKVEVISVKDFAGSAPAEKTVISTAARNPRGTTIARTTREKNFRALFAGDTIRSKPAKPRKSSVAPAPAVTRPATAKVLTGRGDLASNVDSRAVALFRTAHGTQFDPGSSIDRAKMNDLRRRLLNRGQRISMRNQ